MTDDQIKARFDAVMYGTGFLKNGKHVPHEDVYLDPRDARIEALTAENERLRELLCLADELLMDAWGAFPLCGNPLREKMMLIREATGNDYHERKRKARAALEGKQ